MERLVRPLGRYEFLSFEQDRRGHVKRVECTQSMSRRFAFGQLHPTLIKP